MSEEKSGPTRPNDEVVVRCGLMPGHKSPSIERYQMYISINGASQIYNVDVSKAEAEENRKAHAKEVFKKICAKITKQVDDW